MKRRPRHAAYLIETIQQMPMFHTHVKDSHLKISAIGAEVGVSEGATSAQLLSHFPKLHLLMIDSWRETPPEERQTACKDYLEALTQDEHDKAKQKALSVTEFAEERRTVFHLTSQKAAGRIEDGALDFVFLDGDHSEAGVLRDLEAWFPKVRRGGLFAGHDWGSKQLQGVTRAVNGFLEKKNLPLMVAKYKTWWTIKWDYSPTTPISSVKS